MTLEPVRRNRVGGAAYDAGVADLDRLALVLAVTRAPARDVSQPERVLRLLETRDPQAVLDELRGSAVELPLGPDALVEASRQDISKWLATGMTITSILDPAYPTTLAEVREAPALLYAEGSLRQHDLGVCVVGTRRLDDAGADVARTVAAALVGQGLTVVSGLAAGTDTVAHEEALARGGRTVAIMGTGIDSTFPAGNKDLRRRVVAAGGLVATQFPPGTHGSRITFPMRNAVMSGYGLTTVVVAAGEHSGTRIQARKALDHGRGLILTERVVRETTWGAHYAHRLGVTVARRSQDVLDAVSRIIEDRQALALRW